MHCYNMRCSKTFYRTFQFILIFVYSYGAWWYFYKYICIIYIYIKCLKKLWENWTWSDCGKMFWCLCFFLLFPLLLLLRRLLTAVVSRGWKLQSLKLYTETHTYCIIWRNIDVDANQSSNIIHTLAILYIYIQIHTHTHSHEDMRSINEKKHILNMKMSIHTSGRANEKDTYRENQTKKNQQQNE